MLNIVVNIWDSNGRHIARSVSNVSEILGAIRQDLLNGYTVTLRPIDEIKLPRVFDTRKDHRRDN